MKSSILSISNDLKTNKITSKLLIENLYKNITKLELQLGPITLDKNIEKCVIDAELTDKLRSDGQNLSLLAGIPISVKDNFNVLNTRTTAGSKILDNYKSPYNSTIVERLKRNHAITNIKCNMDEFGMGSSMSNSSFGYCINPYSNIEYQKLSPGGSSGASAVSVASGLFAGAIASDTGGSIRQPASFCGIVGFKPSYGLLSRHGLISYASSMDTPGILATSVLDASILFHSVSGYDENDLTTIKSTHDDKIDHYYNNFDPNFLRGKTIGIPDELLVDEIDSYALSQFEVTLNLFREAGAIIKRISVPTLKLSLPCYYIIACAEASSNLSKYDGVRYGQRYVDSKIDYNEMISITRGKFFGDEVIKRILTGTFVLSKDSFENYYKKAMHIRSTIRNDLNSLHNENQIDFIASLTAPVLPYSFNDPPDRTSLLVNDYLTVPANLCGIPAISIPINVKSTIKYDKNNDKYEERLPIGLQLMTSRLNDKRLLEAAYAAENIINYKHIPFVTVDNYK